MIRNSLFLFINTRVGFDIIIIIYIIIIIIYIYSEF